MGQVIRFPRVNPVSPHLPGEHAETAPDKTSSPQKGMSWSLRGTSRLCLLSFPFWALFYITSYFFESYEPTAFKPGSFSLVHRSPLKIGELEWWDGKDYSNFEDFQIWLAAHSGRLIEESEFRTPLNIQSSPIHEHSSITVPLSLIGINQQNRALLPSAVFKLSHLLFTWNYVTNASFSVASAKDFRTRYAFQWALQHGRGWLMSSSGKILASVTPERPIAEIDGPELAKTEADERLWALLENDDVASLATQASDDSTLSVPMPKIRSLEKDQLPSPYSLSSRLRETVRWGVKSSLALLLVCAFAELLAYGIIFFRKKRSFPPFPKSVSTIVFSFNFLLALTILLFRDRSVDWRSMVVWSDEAVSVLSPGAKPLVLPLNTLPELESCFRSKRFFKLEYNGFPSMEKKDVDCLQEWTAARSWDWKPTALLQQHAQEAMNKSSNDDRSVLVGYPIATSLLRPYVSRSISPLITGESTDHSALLCTAGKCMGYLGSVTPFMNLLPEAPIWSLNSNELQNHQTVWIWALADLWSKQEVKNFENSQRAREVNWMSYGQDQGEQEARPLIQFENNLPRLQLATAVSHPLQVLADWDGWWWFGIILVSTLILVFLESFRISTRREQIKIE